MATDITDNKGGFPFVLYDGECPFCRRSVQRTGPALRRAGFALATLQSRGAALTEMLVVWPDGRTFGGADGLVQIARRVWWAWPVWVVSLVPGVMPLLRTAYRFVARHRGCANGACAVPGRAGDRHPSPRIGESHRHAAFFELP